MLYWMIVCEGCGARRPRAPPGGHAGWSGHLPGPRAPAPSPHRRPPRGRLGALRGRRARRCCPASRLRPCTAFLTSPPYWSARDYGGPRGQLGYEATVGGLRGRTRRGRERAGPGAAPRRHAVAGHRRRLQRACRHNQMSPLASTASQCATCRRSVPRRAREHPTGAGEDLDRGWWSSTFPTVCVHGRCGPRRTKRGPGARSSLRGVSGVRGVVCPLGPRSPDWPAAGVGGPAADRSR